MSDLTRGEREALATRLRAGVPEAPDLTDLASTATARARWVRRTRRVGVVLAAAVAVAAVATLPRLLDGNNAPPTTPEPAPARCVSRSHLNHRDFRTGTAAWVRFCSARPSQAASLAPRTVLTRGAAAVVATWQAATSAPGSPVRFCPTGSPPGFTVQVGFTDGTVAEVGIACPGAVSPGGQDIRADPDDVYDEVVAAMGRQEALRYKSREVSGPPLHCPANAADPAQLNSDGASATDLSHAGPVLDLTATRSLVCRYAHGRVVQSLQNRDPEALRLATGIGWQVYGRRTRHSLSVEPLYGHGIPTYVVVLCDRTGTCRSFSVTGHFGLLRIYRTDGTVLRVGYASRLLEPLGALSLLDRRL